jgi:hypothetical protein
MRGAGTADDAGTGAGDGRRKVLSESLLSGRAPRSKPMPESGREGGGVGAGEDGRLFGRRNAGVFIVYIGFFDLECDGGWRIYPGDVVILAFYLNLSSTGSDTQSQKRERDYPIDRGDGAKEKVSSRFGAFLRRTICVDEDESKWQENDVYPVRLAVEPMSAEFYNKSEEETCQRRIIDLLAGCSVLSL